MKASLPFPSLPLSSPFFLCVWEKYGSPLFDANDKVFPLRAECKHRNMDMTQKAPYGTVGVPPLWWWKKEQQPNVLFLLFL